MSPAINGYRRAKNLHLRTSAQIALRNAVAAGKVTRGARCSDCNQPAIWTPVTSKGRVSLRPNLVGHHEDYSKPLDVIWLCHQCHMGKHWSQVNIGAHKDSPIMRAKKIEMAVFVAFLAGIPPEFRFGDIVKFLQVEEAA